MTILALFYTFTIASFTLFRNIHDIHKYQQNVYLTDRYVRWLRGKHHKFFKDHDFSTLISAFLFIAAVSVDVVALKIILLAMSASSLLFSLFVYNFWANYRKTKLPLAFTFRVKRLIATTSIVNILVSLPVSMTGFFSDNLTLMSAGILVCVAVNVFSFINVIIGGIINRPVEKKIAYTFVRDARRILDSNKYLKIIAVTGSYGKTSVKNILGKMLSQKYATLVTPESYNTLMGVVKTIRENLKPYHQVFVVEMGAYVCGEIEEICNLVRPDYSIITSIGEQHLESFKTLENVVSAKGEVFAGLRENGTAFINLSDENILKVPLRGDVNRITYLDAPDPHALERLNLPEPYVTNEKIDVTGKGTNITLKHKNDDSSYETFDVSTKLLGKHNIENIVACTSIALKLGVSPVEINRALSDIEPVKHRLSYGKNALGYTVIDDSFNSNPVGSKNALEALALFEGNVKFIITPGMIELGPDQDMYNYKFGGYIAKYADYAVLVGEKQTRPVYSGMKDAGFDPDGIYVASDIHDAFNRVNSMIKAGDVLLIENDLPDIFNEK